MSEFWTRNMSEAKETLTELGGGIYMLSVNIRPLAGNITFAVGRTGVVAVDSQFAELYDRIMAAIRQVSDLPIQWLINTHHHGDHVGCNAAFGADGATVIAQTRAAYHLGNSKAKVDDVSGPRVERSGQPTIMFDESLNLQVGAHSLSLFHPPQPAHSDSDIFIYFREANVISTGDVFNSLSYPYIDTRVGASIDGLIAGVDAIKQRVNANTVIVPGHGEPSDVTGLDDYRAMLVKVRDRIAAAKAGGLSEPQMVAENLLEDLNSRWFLPNSPTSEKFQRLVYESVR
jgi:cyclase